MPNVTVNFLRRRALVVGERSPDVLRGDTQRLPCEQRWVVGEDLEPRVCGRAVWIDPAWLTQAWQTEISCAACAADEQG